MLSWYFEVAYVIMLLRNIKTRVKVISRCIWLSNWIERLSIWIRWNFPRLLGDRQELQEGIFFKINPSNPIYFNNDFKSTKPHHHGSISTLITHQKHFFSPPKKYFPKCKLNKKMLSCIDDLTEEIKPQALLIREENHPFWRTKNQNQSLKIRIVHCKAIMKWIILFLKNQKMRTIMRRLSKQRKRLIKESILWFQIIYLTSCLRKKWL